MGFQQIMCQNTCTYPKLLPVDGLVELRRTIALKIVQRLCNLQRQHRIGTLVSNPHQQIQLVNYLLLLEILFWGDSPWSSLPDIGTSWTSKSHPSDLGENRVKFILANEDFDQQNIKLSSAPLSLHQRKRILLLPKLGGHNLRIKHGLPK